MLFLICLLTLTFSAGNYMLIVKNNLPSDWTLYLKLRGGTYFKIPSGSFNQQQGNPHDFEVNSDQETTLAVNNSRCTSKTDFLVPVFHLSSISGQVVIDESYERLPSSCLPSSYAINNDIPASEQDLYQFKLDEEVITKFPYRQTATSTTKKTLYVKSEGCPNWVEVTRISPSQDVYTITVSKLPTPCQIKEYSVNIVNKVTYPTSVLKIFGTDNEASSTEKITNFPIRTSKNHFFKIRMHGELVGGGLECESFPLQRLTNGNEVFAEETPTTTEITNDNIPEKCRPTFYAVIKSDIKAEGISVSGEINGMTSSLPIEYAQKGEFTVKLYAESADGRCSHEPLLGDKAEIPGKTQPEEITITDAHIPGKCFPPEKHYVTIDNQVTLDTAVLTYINTDNTPDFLQKGINNLEFNEVFTVNVHVTYQTCNNKLLKEIIAVTGEPTPVVISNELVTESCPEDGKPNPPTEEHKPDPPTEEHKPDPPTKEEEYKPDIPELSFCVPSCSGDNHNPSKTLADISEENKGKSIGDLDLEITGDVNLDDLDVEVTNRISIATQGKLTGTLKSKKEDTKVMIYTESPEQIADLTVEMKSSGAVFDSYVGDFVNKMPPCFITGQVKELIIDFDDFENDGEIISAYMSADEITNLQLKSSKGSFSSKADEKEKLTFGKAKMIAGEDEEKTSYYIYKYKFTKGSNKSNVPVIVGVVVAVVVVVVVIVVVVIFVLKKKKKDASSSQ